MIFDRQPESAPPARRAIRSAYRRDETAALAPLLEAARLSPAQGARVLAHARHLAARSRSFLREHGGVEAFLQEYNLSSEEGVLLMCLAEALLRIPDAATQEQLIRDKLARGHWDAHLGHSGSVFVNASAWGLTLTGKIVTLAAEEGSAPLDVLERLAMRAGEKVVRPALAEAIRLLAGHFVAGAAIEDALARTARAASPIRCSYDCLGEAARCEKDVAFYFDAYRHAIRAIAATRPADALPFEAPGVSVKLSALHPRYEYAQRTRVLAELTPRLTALVAAARAANIGLTLDAEEADRLDLMLDLFELAYRDETLKGWEGFGLAVQAYQKCAPAALDWLLELARMHRRRIPVRLVKGAYWDSEIKRAQQLGLDGYPVYTRKHATDVSYLACARFLLDHRDVFFGQFATHNAHTVAWVLERAGNSLEFEFQRLHGMGEALYRALAEEGVTVPCRVYAPVGAHEQLLPYLVRRLLENGANTSFVNQLANPDATVEEIVADPVARTEAAKAAPHPRIPLPANLYGAARRNAAGLDLSDPETLPSLDRALAEALQEPRRAAPRAAGRMLPGIERPVTDPADRRRVVGIVAETEAAIVNEAFAAAAAAFPAWEQQGAGPRAAILERAAERLERHRAELMALIVREGGRTLPDALSEVREAADACRYYAAEARRLFEAPQRLTGPTGESNALGLRGRGVFVCLSPWNFPLAIFTGQIAAALAAGNTVIAKPARQTPLVAHLAVRLLHEAGVPGDALHFLPGSAAVLGDALLAHPHLAGVAMTGSTDTARRIQRKLAARHGPILPLIAETGGQNAMIVDSSALPEQVVVDALASAFNSAGQRCSALRVLFVQQDIADRVLSPLAGAMDELAIGDPMLLSTDVGPVIDESAQQQLAAHAERLRAQGKPLKELPLPSGTEHGSFFAPRVFEIGRLDMLEREVFGPILHVVRYAADALERVIDAINATGYGLTLGVHSRLESTWERVRARARVGNLYVNRNMIGAVIGVQPFGGEGLSGTGPKAGGPHYLPRFAVERTVTINTAAVGGNAALLSLPEDP